MPSPTVKVMIAFPSPTAVTTATPSSFSTVMTDSSLEVILTSKSSGIGK